MGWTDTPILGSDKVDMTFLINLYFNPMAKFCHAKASKINAQSLNVSQT
jgi:hypothetical protein